MSEILDIQVEDWEKVVEYSEIPVVVEYWHPKCAACQHMLPIYKQLQTQIGDQVRLTRMNILERKENRMFAIEEGIRGTPTFTVYCSGRPIGAVIGVRTLNELEQEISMIINNKDACLSATPLTDE